MIHMDYDEDELKQLRADIEEIFPKGEARNLWLKWLAGLEARLCCKGAPSRALH